MTRAIAILVLGLASACVVDNDAHCGNNAGDATCRERGGTTPFCNTCVSENNGCVDSPAPLQCEPDGGSTSEIGGTAETTPVTTAPTTVGMTTAMTMGMTAGDPTSAADATDDGDDTTAVSATFGSSGDDRSSTSDGAASSSDDGGSTTSGSTTEGSTGSGSSMTTTGDAGESSSGSSSGGGETSSDGGPECGNGIVEPGEQCDGANLNGATCPAGEVGPPACTGSCMINLAPCCVPSGGGCLILGDCCPGLSCLVTSCG